MPRLCRLAAVLAATTLPTCSSSMKVYRVDRVDFPNTSGRLKNGLRVVVQPDESQPHVRVLVRYEVGAAHDPKEKKGIAHLVEHLAFRLGDELVEIEEAAPHRASSAGREEEKATKKESNYKTIRYVVSENAYTTFDETVYWKRVAPPQLENVLQDLANQMDDFTPQISEEVFEAEREVVHNERRSRYETKPLDRVWLDLYDRMLPAEHPYQGDAVIGSHETISRIELADVSAYLRANYHPGNATLVIVGPVDPNETLSMVMECFGGKPKREPSVREVPDWTPTFREATVVVPKANETMLTVAWPLGPRDSRETTAVHLLDSAIGGWFWGRLVTNREHAYWVRSFVSDNDVESLFVVQALVRNHGDVGAVCLHTTV